MTVRLALASLAVVLAAMAYPWESTMDWWILGVGAAVVIAVFAWWRGQFVTDMIGRRLAIWLRNHSKADGHDPNRVTVVLEVDDPADIGVSLPLVAGYVERFGIRSEKVRVTTHDRDGARTTWVSLTLDARSNLAALQARSADLPLAETAEVAGRRLADHLREAALDAVIVDAVTAPLCPNVREKWSGVVDDCGAISAYGIPVDDRLDERLEEVWSQQQETWTAVEFTGTAGALVMAAVCAFRTPEPVRGVPLTGLTTRRGLQKPLLAALSPDSVELLGVPREPVPSGLAELSRT
ncbi:type VII secretion protein EccE [Mycobacterium sp. E740]|uniref:type VII secretion protein EccE n=1 Tax=Mycobacterium sp. E740 TaxID=1834149 RepID=UPI000800DAE3|nr:type VII secretion protein EccE [Mycobacterium sp. E740]OBI84370.1 type VII secretion protein EccE [Mycobacterium sp. E740]